MPDISRILVVTPEITYLPTGMGNLAQRLNAQAGGLADVFASFCLQVSLIGCQSLKVPATATSLSGSASTEKVTLLFSNVDAIVLLCVVCPRQCQIIPNSYSLPNFLARRARNES